MVCSEAFEKITFGDPDINVQTLKADIKGILSHEFSETMKGNITVQYSDYEKMCKTFAGYDATTNVVTMDGYLDPTERRNFIISGNLVTEFNTGSVTIRFYLVQKIWILKMKISGLILSSQSARMIRRLQCH